MKPNYCMCLSNALYLLQRPRHPSPRVACGSIDFHDGACAPKIGGAVPTVCCTCFSLGGCSVYGGGKQRKRVRRRFGHGERSLTRPLPRSSFPMWLCLFSSPPSPPQKKKIDPLSEEGGGERRRRRSGVFARSMEVGEEGGRREMGDLRPNGLLLPSFPPVARSVAGKDAGLWSPHRRQGQQTAT